MSNEEINSASFIPEGKITEALELWKTMRTDTERYIANAPAVGYSEDAPENKKVASEIFQQSVSAAYDVFCKAVGDPAVSKSLLLLFNEIKSYALNKEIASFKNGLWQIRTAIAESLCDMLARDIDYGGSKKLIFRLDGKCNNYSEGNYLYDLSDHRFSFMWKEAH